MALEQAFSAFGQTHVISLIRPRNSGSIRVACRIGMRREGIGEVMGNEVVIYGIDRAVRSPVLERRQGVADFRKNDAGNIRELRRFRRIRSTRRKGIFIILKTVGNRKSACRGSLRNLIAAALAFPSKGPPGRPLRIRPGK